MPSMSGHRKIQGGENTTVLGTVLVTNTSVSRSWAQFLELEPYFETSEKTGIVAIYNQGDRSDLTGTLTDQQGFRFSVSHRKKEKTWIFPFK